MNWRRPSASRWKCRRKNGGSEWRKCAPWCWRTTFTAGLENWFRRCSTSKCPKPFAPCLRPALPAARALIIVRLVRMGAMETMSGSPDATGGTATGELPFRRSCAMKLEARPLLDLKAWDRAVAKLGGNDSGDTDGFRQSLRFVRLQFVAVCHRPKVHQPARVARWHSLRAGYGSGTSHDALRSGRPFRALRVPERSGAVVLGRLGRSVAGGGPEPG